MALDRLAQIAADGMGGNFDLLEIPQPVEYHVGKCRLTDDTESCKAVATAEKMSTKEQLNHALKQIRAQYAPYLENHAPQLQACKKITKLTEFVLNGKEKIALPWYGEPVGNAVQTYETDFEVEPLDSSEAVYIRFKGADYIAFVYVNNECVGSHEGFFSPFEFEITEYVKVGKNNLRVVLKNDYVFMGHEKADRSHSFDGDKMYGATGLGYDEPTRGWHHCPAGMGIYNDVTIEVRNKIHVTDLFVRQGKEVWVEVQNAEYADRALTFKLSVYGQNFKETVFEKMEYIPHTYRILGMGDSLNQARLKDVMREPLPLLVRHGLNVYKIPISVPSPKLWDLETPNLYQLQVEVWCDGQLCDTAKTQFGIREFTQDLEDTPKGMFYLNGRKIRLRGANTMGFEQLDVMRGDIDQLIDDILLAKICNLNYWRLTQRPVQDEVYEYCDKLGFMLQTDLPLFASMRRNKFAEGVRQAEEMERMIRNHASNIMVAYFDEPIPNGNNLPHRQMVREELEQFFAACDNIVKFNNPDRVIKHIDGDYEPPSVDLPDTHCYPLWYNGHGIDIGQLNKGYWMPVKPGWYYACGEYGSEGLECAELMYSEYPSEWMEEPFHPGKIYWSQVADFHYFFHDTPDTLEDWITLSQKHQAYATTFMTEALRRDPRMISQAIHLFIDAWPSGWMKSIMDCKRNPKMAYFACRDAMEPIHVSLRTDRYSYYAGEPISIEAYLCNDTAREGACSVVYELYDQNMTLVKRAQCQGNLPVCDVDRVDDAYFTIDHVEDRERFLLKAILMDEEDNVLAYNSVAFDVFEDCVVPKNDDVVWIEKLEPGEYEIAGETVKVKAAGMLPLHFVSRRTGHPAVAAFEPEDFKNWYDAKEDMITPILDNTFTAEGFTPILVTGNTDDKGNWTPALAAAEKWHEGKRYVICQVDLRQENPVAKRFLKSVMEQ